MMWGVWSFAGVGPQCFIKSDVNTAVWKHILQRLTLLSADQLHGHSGIRSHQDLAPTRTDRTPQKWPWSYCVLLSWTSENLCGVVKRTMRDPRPHNTHEVIAPTSRHKMYLRSYGPLYLSDWVLLLITINIIFGMLVFLHYLTHVHFLNLHPLAALINEISLLWDQ